MSSGPFPDRRAPPRRGAGVARAHAGAWLLGGAALAGSPVAAAALWLIVFVVAVANMVLLAAALTRAAPLPLRRGGAWTAVSGAGLLGVLAALGAIELALWTLSLSAAQSIAREIQWGYEE